MTINHTSNKFAHSTLDQSAADLVLLSTSLENSRKISERLSKMLNGFDDRLSKLEKILSPIHNETKTLTTINANIDKTILSVNQVLGNHDTALRQEMVIQKRPDSNQVSQYIVALDEIVKSISEMKRTGTTTGESYLHVQNLLETGVGHLSDIFIGWVKSFTGPPLKDPIRQTADKTQPLGFSSKEITQLSGIYDYLEKLKVTVKEERLSKLITQIVSRYSSVRIQYLNQSLKPVSSSAVESMRTGDGAGMLSSFIDCMLDMFQIEYQMLTEIFKAINQRDLKSVFSQIISPSLELLSETGQSVNSVIKRSLSSYIGSAFDTYSIISSQLDRFELEVRRRSARKENELGELLHSFKGSCLRSLPEFIADTKTFGEKLPIGSETSNTMTSEMTIAVLDYLKMLCLYQEIVEEFLSVLGDGNWIFASVSGTVGRPRNNDNGDGEQLLPKYLNDALSTLYAALESRSKNLKLPASASSTITSNAARAGIGAIYMLNNFTYIRHEVIESSIPEILGEQLEDDLNKRIRTLKVGYLEIWAPLISALMDSGGGAEDGKSGFGLGAVKSALPGQQAGAERRDVKDRLARFNEAFEEVVSLHKIARIDNWDVEMKEKLRNEIERMIVPTYAKFAQRHEGGQFSKHPSKYLKMTAEQLEESLDRLFQ
ncbi:Cullin repeat-like-containing domain protein [Phakopsora pachyrhizi]|uniref:Exocyst complex protein EXO70 n=1 Tax=Phakopsora pachyrhizi TaxID=170000 RepID=A0AAV0BDX3_PHAPC|nr:Cullin repeat-like-containing domain protein [Phakopsora pachyrhizi]CAH7685484.1 Cullin repeat-like-containing domain protein [Phakopsora pachyrhizi]